MRSKLLVKQVEGHMFEEWAGHLDGELTEELIMEQANLKVAIKAK